MYFLELPTTLCIGLLVREAVGAFASRDVLPNTGLTILASNDLLNVPPPRSGAILINEPSTFSEAQGACRSLHEELVSPEPTLTELNASLRYQIYQGNYPENQLFWTLEAPCGSCRAIDALGRLHLQPCADKLPALCTQSAPTSNGTFEDTSSQYQITRSLGQGQVTGYRDFYTWKFLGVRFAAQPKRFGYSTPYNNTDSNATALTPPKACVQPDKRIKRDMTSEDCLFVNIWTPYLPASTPTSGPSQLKPVTVWIHGGSYATGANLEPSLDGTNLASRGDIVVVAVGYRLGNLGFLPFIDDIHNGNYGIGDIVTALEWVAKNIANFGGDPGRVTLMGQSAGGSAVHALTGSPKAHGLFHKAISMSDPFGLDISSFNYDRFQTPVVAYNSSTITLLKDMSCQNAADPVECLRAVDPFILVTNSSINYRFPINDGIYLTAGTYDFADSNALGSEIPAIFGVVKDEFAGDLPIPPDNMTLKIWISGALARALTGQPLDLTPYFVGSGLMLPANATTDEIFNISSHLLTDALFTCLTQAKSYSASKHGSLKTVYTYNFNRTYQLPINANRYCVPPKTEARPYGDPDQIYYHCHSSDLLVVFGTIVRYGLPDRDGLDIPFSQMVMDYWSSFIRTADPNPDHGYLEARGYLGTLEQVRSSPWTPLDSRNPLTRELQWNGRMMPFLDKSSCAGIGLSLESLEHN